MACALSALAALLLLASCETLAAGNQQVTAKPQGEIKKSPQLTEGQLQEQFILKRSDGRRSLEAKKYGAALDAYLEANEIRANSPDILLGIGQAYMGLEYWDKAKVYFDRYLAIEKDRNAEIYRMIAHLYADQLEFFDLAAKVWTKAIETSPQGPLSTDYYGRGLAYARLSQPKRDDAIADFKLAIDLATKAKDDKTVALATKAMAGLASTK